MKGQFITFLFLVPLLTFGQFGRFANDLSFYWGKSYRLNNSFYNTFDISYESYGSTCLNAKYSGFGVRLDNYNDDNYSFSIKYFRSLVRRPSFFMIPYWGFSPVVFKMEELIGLNIKPEIGIRFNTGAFTHRQPISLSFIISYGYDIPVIKEKEFLVGRHDLTAKIGLSFNINDIRYYLRKDRKKDTGLQQPPVDKE